MMSVAWPRTLGPEHRQRDADRRRRRARRSRRAARARMVAEQPAGRAARSPSTSRPACRRRPCGRPKPPRGGGSWPAASARRRAASSASSRSVAHRAASSGAQLRGDDLGVGRAASRAARGGCRGPTTWPSSSTRIWSASMMVDTRWATMTTVASAVCGRERGAQPGVGGQVERGERVVEQVDLRAGAPAPGRWPGAGAGRPTRSRRPGRSGRRARRAWPARSRRPGRSRAPPTAPRRWRRRRRSAGC